MILNDNHPIRPFNNCQNKCNPESHGAFAEAGRRKVALAPGRGGARQRHRDGFNDPPELKDKIKQLLAIGADF